jgi:hypothetical protein
MGALNTKLLSLADCDAEWQRQRQQPATTRAPKSSKLKLMISRNRKKMQRWQSLSLRILRVQQVQSVLSGAVHLTTTMARGHKQPVGVWERGARHACLTSSFNSMENAEQDAVMGHYFTPGWNAMRQERGSSGGAKHGTTNSTGVWQRSFLSMPPVGSKGVGSHGHTMTKNL